MGHGVTMDSGDLPIADNGWDSRAWVADGWLHREPRRPEVRPRLLAEARLMPWLAPQLDLPVPVPELTATGVRHRLLVGVPMDPGNPSTTVGRSLGTFLRTLHAVDPGQARAHGALDQQVAAAERAEVLEQLRARVLPLLPRSVQPAGEELLDSMLSDEGRLIHGDLGSEHILIRDGVVAGIIDWTDAHLGDPALDLSWLLYGAAGPLAGAVADAYGVEEPLRRRALAWYRLAPWHSVHHGLLTGRPAVVEAALPEVAARLTRGPADRLSR